MVESTRFSMALNEVELTKAQKKLLGILLEGGESERTPEGIAELMGFKHFITVNSVIGKIGRKFAEVLIEVPVVDYWFQAIADFTSTPSGNVWTLHKGLTEALVEAGFGNGVLDSEVINDNKEIEQSFWEGERRVSKHISSHRAKAAREECIRLHGATCWICGFDFAKQYGPLFDGFIHVHHIEPLAKTLGPRLTDPTNDLIPVCANCHAIIHSRRDPYTPVQIKKLIQEAKKQKSTVPGTLSDR